MSCIEGKKVLITAGPTKERIDPVRFITNDSSGKMGIALANAANSLGADVTLILGPVNIIPEEGIEVIDVESSEEMYDALTSHAHGVDIAIFSAAVCDIKPISVSGHKLKKGIDDEALFTINTVETIDILKTFAAEHNDVYIVGFAAETDDLLENAERKLASKGADMIIANQVGEGKTFGKDRSKAWMVTDESIEELPEMPKIDLANIIFEKICVNIARPS